MGLIHDFLQRAADFTANVEKVEQNMQQSPRIPSRAMSTVTDPYRLGTIFRAVQILQTAITGLPIRQMRGNIPVKNSSLVDQPDPLRSRNAFMAETISDLATNGNSFWQKIKLGNDTVALRLLPANLVNVRATNSDMANPMPVFDYNGETYSSDDVCHLKLVNIPGRLRGLGPIQSAREEIASATMSREFRMDWFANGDHSSGAYSTEAALTPDEAQTVTDQILSADPTKPKFLFGGLKYTRFSMSDADVAFLDSMKFDTTQIARIMGIPASLMLASVEGSNLTYANIEQSWIEFADYTLTAYTQEITDALESLLPRGNYVRFDWDNSRRSDTKDRFESYKIAIESGFITVNEVREKEGYMPLDAAQLDALNASKKVINE